MSTRRDFFRAMTREAKSAAPDAARTHAALILGGLLLLSAP
jgi:hypothetical protein